MKSPAFQWYAAEYLADMDVSLMSLEEEGAYVRLLNFCWREGSIPNDDEMLSRLCKGASTTVLRVVKERFQPSADDPSKLVHHRLEDERKKQREWREKSAEGGRKSAKLRSKNEPSNRVNSRVVEPIVNQDPNQKATLQSSSSSSINTPIVPTGDGYSEGFKKFWEAYPSKTGKDAAWKAWQKRKMGALSFETVMASMEAQKNSRQWKEGYIPNPTTWINQGRWKDEGIALPQSQPESGLTPILSEEEQRRNHPLLKGKAS